MERTKVVAYQSCGLCDNAEEAKGQCDICGRWLCTEHCENYPWGDQLYQFCPSHYLLVHNIIRSTGIPIAFVVTKLKDEGFSGHVQQLWNERGYEEKWIERME